MFTEILLFLVLVGIIGVGTMVYRLARNQDNGEAQEALQDALREQQRAFQQEISILRQELQSGFREQMSVLLNQLQENQQGVQRALLDFSGNMSQRAEAAQQLQQQAAHQLQSLLQDLLDRLGKRTEARLDAVRDTVERKLKHLQEDNAAQLDRIRHTVDERLTSTLEARLKESFSLVSENLEQVQRGLGEMQSLAIGVGELKRVLTNVKQRGTWAEVQLGALLSEMLAPQQYAANVKTNPDSREIVEYAIRLPGPDGEGEVWLPVDSKFPLEDYQRLVEASERGDPIGVENAAREVRRVVMEAAKDIAQKYLKPPGTTDFGIMYLPTEGLYAEVVRQAGVVEELQRRHRVVVAGPTTFTALLNSLQVGFKTLAMQKQSARAWRVLEEVKVEFGRFAEWIGMVKNRFEQASKELDKVQTRTRAVERKLRGVGRSDPLEEGEITLDLPDEDG
jgi:DNA recombination protein RmuC